MSGVQTRPALPINYGNLSTPGCGGPAIRSALQGFLLTPNILKQTYLYSTLLYNVTMMCWCWFDLFCFRPLFLPRGMCQKILGDQSQPGVQGIPCYHWISLGSGKLEQRGFTGFQDVKRFHRWLCPQVEQSYHQQQKMLEVWAPATWTITWHTSLG